MDQYLSLIVGFSECCVLTCGICLYFHGTRRFNAETLSHGFQIYCRTDRVCICPECETLDHYDHDTVSVADEWVETKVRETRCFEANHSDLLSVSAVSEEQRL